MAAINDLVRSEIKDYPELSGEEINTLIVEPGKRLLPELSPDLAWFARKKLKEHGVQVLLNTKITGLASSHVELGTRTARSATPTGAAESLRAL